MEHSACLINSPYDLTGVQLSTHTHRVNEISPPNPISNNPNSNNGVRSLTFFLSLLFLIQNTYILQNECTQWYNQKK